VSRQTLDDERRTQLKEAGVYVIVEFEYRATVIEPEGIVTRGVRDVRTYLSDKFYQRIDSCVRQGTLDDNLISLRQNLETQLTEPLRDSLVKVESVLFDVRTEGNAGKALARLSEEAIERKQLEAQNRLDDVARNNMLKIIGNDDLLLAEMMRLDDNSRVHELLKLRLDQRNISFQQNLSLLDTMMKHGILEAYQIKRDYPQFFEDLTRLRLMPGLSGRQETTPTKELPSSTPEKS
jgi:hypothetical protein